MGQDSNSLVPQNVHEDTSEDTTSLLSRAAREETATHAVCAECALDIRRNTSEAFLGWKRQSNCTTEGCDFRWFQNESLPGVLACDRSVSSDLSTALHDSVATESLDWNAILPPDSNGECCYFRVEDLPSMQTDLQYTIIVRTRHSLSDPELVTTPKIDFRLVKDWFENDSGLETVVTERSLVVNRSLSPPSILDTTQLCVIDCATGTMDRLPSGASYVTLSYIWGVQASSPAVDYVFTMESAPRTIKDSIIVCLELGYLYLWIDRYCIPQNDDKERHRQVAQMDRIYQHSAVTIVACEGKDPQYGLPGISRIRKPYPSIWIEDFGYLRRTPLAIDVWESPWAQRGWTFQEALLSQTCLYFTNQQLYLENAHGVKCEAESLIRKSNGHEYDAYRLNLMKRPIFEQTSWLNMSLDVYQCIRKFTTRSISFHRDTLNALNGILAVFKRKFGVRHVCGLPYIASSHHQSPSLLEPGYPTLHLSLQFATQLHSVRYHGFPSWSWAGWTGTKSWEIAGKQIARPPLPVVLDLTFESGIAVEFAPNLVVHWDKYQAEYDTIWSQKTDIIKFIHIRAYMVPIIRCRRISYAQSWVEILDLLSPSGVRMVIQVIDTELHNFEQCAILRFPYSRHDGNWLPHLLIRNIGTHWERVASFIGSYRDEEGTVFDDRPWPGTLQTIRLG